MTMALCCLCMRLVQHTWLVSLPVAAAPADMGARHLQDLCGAQADVSGALTSLLHIVPKLFAPSSASQQLGLQQVRLCEISARARCCAHL